MKHPFLLVALCLFLYSTAFASSVTVGWSVPSFCSATAPCVFVISRARASGTTICDGTPMLVGSSAVNAASFKDTTVTKGHWCWTVATVQGGQISGPPLPSNNGLQLTLKAAAALGVKIQ
jgi:hypothetical protein